MAFYWFVLATYSSYCKRKISAITGFKIILVFLDFKPISVNFGMIDFAIILPTSFFFFFLPLIIIYPNFLNFLTYLGKAGF